MLLIRQPEYTHVLRYILGFIVFIIALLLICRELEKKLPSYKDRGTSDDNQYNGDVE